MMQRRDMMIGMTCAGAGLLVSNRLRQTAFASPALSALAFAHSILRAAPQWTILEDGQLALWFLLREGVRSFNLSAPDDSDARHLEALGITTEREFKTDDQGLFVLPVASSQAARALAGALFRVGCGAGSDEPFSLRVPLAVDESANAFSFLFGSCLKPESELTSPTLETMSRTPANFTLLMGDTTYYQAEHFGSEGRMHGRMLEIRNRDGFRALGASMPVIAGWDDHDFGPNNSGRDYKNKALSRKVFLSQYPRSEAGADQVRQAIHASYKVGQTKIILLDSRTFREPSPKWGDSGGDYLGQEQLDWIDREVRARDHRLLIVGGGNQFFAKNIGKEVYSSHGKEFAKFVSILKSQLETPVLFLSGDIHMTELINLSGIFPRGAFELTCSGIGNSVSLMTRLLKKVTPGGYLNNSAGTFCRLKIDGSSVHISHLGTQGDLLKEVTLFD